MATELKHYAAGPSGPDAIRRANVSIDSAAVPAADVLETTVAFPGAKLGQVVSASPASSLAALHLGFGGARVTADDTIGITLVNPTAAPINPPAITWAVSILM